MAKNSDARHHRGDFRCAACGGADQDPRGQGRRCFGWTTGDGWIHCSRVDSRWPDKSGNTWAHPPDTRRATTEPIQAEAQRDEQAEQRRRTKLIRTHRETVPITDPSAEPARLYLASRGLIGVTSIALRFHPALAYHDPPNGLIGMFPALVALVLASDGRPICLHRTYLTARGEKAPVPTPRKMMSPAIKGSTMGGAIRLNPECGPRLAIAEGIETGLSFARLSGWPVWSTASAGGMKAVVLPPHVAEVAIAADHDSSGTGQVSARALARRLIAEGRKVKIITPPRMGTDWNDVLLEGTPA
jgi:putative DNA primase/helicase